jgi:hypothetical protein
MFVYLAVTDGIAMVHHAQSFAKPVTRMMIPEHCRVTKRVLQALVAGHSKNSTRI